MTSKQGVLSWGCLAAWLFGTLLAVVAGFTVFFVVMSSLGESLGTIPDLAASLLLTVCLGIVIGLAQWSILRNYLPRSALWIALTLLGFLVASPVLISMSNGFGPSLPPLSSLLMAAALGAALGIAQWIVLRTKVKQSLLWIVISLISWILAGAAGLFLRTLSWELGPILHWLGLFFVGTVLSGLGMLWLFRAARPPAPASAPG